MPTAPLRPCLSRPCAELVTSGRCLRHTAHVNRDRGNSSQRGYDWDWRRLRDRFLRARCGDCGDTPVATCRRCGGTGLANALCAECLDAGRMIPAQEVDHVIPWLESPALRLDTRDLQSLCSRHHTMKTRAEESGSGLSPFQARQAQRVRCMMAGLMSGSEIDTIETDPVAYGGWTAEELIPTAEELIPQGYIPRR